MGGGNSRILRHLYNRYDCWNIDKLEGVGFGPKGLKDAPYKLIRDYMGNFNKELPDNYFDLVFSISALEHVPPNDQKIHGDIIDDINRVLKPDAYSLQLLDIVIRFDGGAWINGIGPRMFERMDTLNSFIPYGEVVDDPDLYCMSEKAYLNYIFKFAKKSYREFGRMTSMNILWQKSVVEID